MLTLLRGFHAIAAQRGDGLRPELLGMTSPSQAWSSIETMENASPIRGDDSDEKNASTERNSSTEVVILPTPKC